MFEHWGDAIYWDQFTWEAFATLLAALLAVAGAVAVGLRQVAIQQRQAEIADLEVRSTLWRERLAVYDATRAYLSHIVTKASVPGRQTPGGKMTSQPAVAMDVAQAFFTALDRSQFLFRPEVHRALDEVWRDAEKLADLRGSADIMYEPTKTPMEKRAAELRKKLVDRHANVAAIFGDELKLTDRVGAQRQRNAG